MTAFHQPGRHDRTVFAAAPDHSRAVEEDDLGTGLQVRAADDAEPGPLHLGQGFNVSWRADAAPTASPPRRPACR